MKKIISHCLLFGFLFLVSCGEEDKNENDGKTVFRYNESGGINTLDPSHVWRYEDFLIVNQLYNNLVTLDENMELIPDLASSWELSSNGKVYTFHLRKGVLFHKSVAFTDEEQRVVKAEDVIYSFLRVIDPATASPGKYVFRNIDRSEVSDYKGIIAENDSTVKVYLSEPQPSFLYQLSLPYGSIVPSEAVDYFGNDFGENPVGSGPFMFKKWMRDVKLILVKNEDYFEKDLEGNSLPYLDAVSVSFIKDKHVEFVEFKNGQFEMISGLNEDEKDELIDPSGALNKNLQEQFYLQKTPWLNTDYLGILMDERMDIVKTSPLKNKLVRQAIAHAIDIQSLIKHLRNNIGTPASTGFVPKGMPGYEEYAIKGYTYDLDKAQELLHAAGYSDFSKIPPIKLAATAEYKAMCEFLQHSLTELGMTVEIDILESSNMSQSIAQFETNFYRKSWIADFPDAINYFQLFYSKNFYPESGYNYTHFKNNTYDELYELALVEDSTELRYEYYQNMQQIIHDEVPVIPLFYAETLRFLNKTVTGLKGNSLNMLNLKEVKVEAEQ